MIFLDTEFNEFGGDLISIALVSDRAEFYAVLPCPNPKLWVAKHVMPFTGPVTDTPESLAHRLAAYLTAHQGQEIICDWPDDVVHLSRALILGPGIMAPVVDYRCRYVSTYNHKVPSVTPHNALSDARGLRDWWRTQGKVAA